MSTYDLEPPLSTLALEAAKARAKLLATMAAKPYVVWKANELRERAGAIGPVGSYALLKLVSDGVLELDSYLRVNAPYETRRQFRAALSPQPEHPPSQT